MRKYSITTLVLMLIMFLVSCSNTNSASTHSTSNPNKQKVVVSVFPSIKPNSAENKKSKINEISNGEHGTFYLDMTREDVLAILKNKNFDTSSEIEITSTEGTWDYGNKELFAGGIIFSFDKAYKLYKIVIEDTFPTTLGLKNGDSLETMEKLYGKNYNTTTNFNKAVLYNYSMGNHEFFVYVVDDIVKMWGIQKNELGKQNEQQPTNNNDDIGTKSINNIKWLQFSFYNFQKERELIKSFYGKDITDIEEGKYGSDKEVKIAVTLEDVNNDGNKEIIAIIFHRFFVGGQFNGLLSIYDTNEQKIHKNITISSLYFEYSKIENQQQIGIINNTNDGYCNFIVNKDVWIWDGKGYSLSRN